MHAACLHGHRDVVKFLIQKGANPNSGDNWNCTPLHNAAGSGHLQIVDMLCQGGADLEARSSNKGISRY